MVQIYGIFQDRDMFYYTLDRVEGTDFSMLVTDMDSFEELVSFNSEGSEKGWGFICDMSEEGVEHQMVSCSRNAEEVSKLAEENGLAFPCESTLIFRSKDDLPEYIKKYLGD